MKGGLGSDLHTERISAGKGELDSFQVDRIDTEMCEIFGVPVEQSEESLNLT